MTADEYETIACEHCAGTGAVYDSTNADKVATGGNGRGICSTCRGAGTRQRRIPSPEYLAYVERERAAVRAAVEVDESAGLPEWMEYGF